MSNLSLPAVCDRAAARALYPDLRDGVGNVPVTIEAGEVERIGQSMLQVLASAAQSEAGITIAAPSPAFTEALRRSGLEDLLAKEPSA